MSLVASMYPYEDYVLVSKKPKHKKSHIHHHSHHNKSLASANYTEAPLNPDAVQQIFHTTEAETSADKDSLKETLSTDASLELQRQKIMKDLQDFKAMKEKVIKKAEHKSKHKAISTVHKAKHVMNKY